MTIWRATALVIIALWGVSLALPVDRVHDAWTYGSTWLFLGWLGFAVGQFGWLANILIFIGVYGLSVASPPSPTAGAIMGGLVTALLINTLFWRAEYSDAGAERIAAFGAGYYLWMAATLLTGIAVFARSRTKEHYG